MVLWVRLHTCQMASEGGIRWASQWGYRFHPSSNVDLSAACFRLSGLPFPAEAGSSGWQRPTGETTEVSMALAHSIAWACERKTNSTRKHHVMDWGGLHLADDLGDNPPTAEHRTGELFPNGSCWASGDEQVGTSSHTAWVCARIGSPRVGRVLFPPDLEFENPVVIGGLDALHHSGAGQQHLCVIAVVPFR